MRLIIGNKNYSSWSLRAWLPLRQCRIAFEEERIALFEPGYKQRIFNYSPAGKVPVLIDGSTTYAVPLDTQAQDYVDHLWNLPSMLEWRSAAVAETEFIAEDEPYR
jgi:hypothetical protein